MKLYLILALATAALSLIGAIALLIKSGEVKSP